MTPYLFRDEAVDGAGPGRGEIDLGLVGPTDVNSELDGVALLDVSPPPLATP